MKKSIILSVVISAYNEEKKIKDCLESVSFAQEIIVIDNSSQDKTSEIAKKYTENIYKRENNLMLNVNKNYGFSKAKGEWILSLDADERVTEELAQEIKNVISGKWQMENNKSSVNGYWIPRKNIIFGKWIEHAGWYPDYQLRLFKAGKGKFEEQHVHEMIQVEGESAHLKHHLLHLNFETVAQFLHKHITIYAPNEASELVRNGYVFEYLDVIRFPVKEFLSRFFVREGYKDGLHGLVLSLLIASYHLFIAAYLWEQKGFPEEKNPQFLSKVNKQFRKSAAEFEYWFLTIVMQKTNNPLKKISYKLLRKYIKVRK